MISMFVVFAHMSLFTYCGFAQFEMPFNDIPGAPIATPQQIAMEQLPYLSESAIAIVVGKFEFEYPDLDTAIAELGVEKSLSFNVETVFKGEIKSDDRIKVGVNSSLIQITSLNQSLSLHTQDSFSVSQQKLAEIYSVLDGLSPQIMPTSNDINNAKARLLRRSESHHGVAIDEVQIHSLALKASKRRYIRRAYRDFERRGGQQSSNSDLNRALELWADYLRLNKVSNMPVTRPRSTMVFNRVGQGSKCLLYLSIESKELIYRADVSRNYTFLCENGNSKHFKAHLGLLNEEFDSNIR